MSNVNLVCCNTSLEYSHDAMETSIPIMSSPNTTGSLNSKRGSTWLGPARRWDCNLGSLRHGTHDLHKLTCTGLGQWMRGGLPSGCNPLQLGQRLGRGHCQVNPMMRGRKWIYYHCVSARAIQDTKRLLTLNDYVLTHLFVVWALTADLVGKAITLMLEGLTTLTSRDLHH